jgi:hypothetical protein
MLIKYKHRNNAQGRLILLAALMFISPRLHAADDAAPPEPPKKWDTTAAAGITLTRGNSDTFLGTVGIDTKRKWVSDEAMFGLSGG